MMRDTRNEEMWPIDLLNSLILIEYQLKEEFFIFYFFFVILDRIKGCVGWEDN